MVWCPGESGDQPVSCVEIDTKVVLLREKILPARWRSVGNGKKFSLLARNGRISWILGVLGEFCTGWVRWWVLPGEFCTGWVRWWVWGGVVAGENSPCSVAQCWEREKILPAREKWPDFGVFGRAGRVLYRVGPCVGLVGGGFVVWSPASPEISR